MSERPERPFRPPCPLGPAILSKVITPLESKLTFGTLLLVRANALVVTSQGEYLPGVTCSFPHHLRCAPNAPRIPHEFSPEPACHFAECMGMARPERIGPCRRAIVGGGRIQAVFRSFTCRCPVPLTSQMDLSCQGSNNNKSQPRCLCWFGSCHSRYEGPNADYHRQGLSARTGSTP